DGAAEKQQADEKQEMVGSDQNVVNARRKELLDDGDRALTRARKVLEAIVRAVENGLCERAAFVHVEKCLVRGIVREHPCGHLDGARRRVEREAQSQTERLSLGNRFEDR